MSSEEHTQEGLEGLQAVVDGLQDGDPRALFAAGLLVGSLGITAPILTSLGLVTADFIAGALVGGVAVAVATMLVHRVASPVQQDTVNDADDAPEADDEQDDGSESKST